MKERSRRLILFLAAAAISSSLYFKGHGPSRKDGSVAFLPCTSSGVTVRLAGAVKAQGVYTFDKEEAVAVVTKMTVPVFPGALPATAIPDMRIKNGDIVEISSGAAQLPKISVKKMNARERMLLGIPLRPNQMDLDDWGCLPGKGPELAKRIMADRQKYGDFPSVEAVQRVPGIGENKYNMLRKYF